MDILDYYDYHSPDMRSTLMNVSMEMTFVDSTHPRYQMPVHWHMESELILVLSGELQLSLDGKIIQMEAYDAALISGGRLHGARADDCIYCCVNYRPETLLLGTMPDGLARQVLLENPSCLTAFHGKGSPVAQTVLSLVETLSAKELGCEVTAQGLLMMLYGNIMRNQLYDLSATSTRAEVRVMPLKRVLQMVRSEYARTITLEELADVAGMSPRYFCRYFQQLVHESPIAYLNFFRVEVAGDRLINTDDAVADIAADCGFKDASYFIRIFRRYKGMPPRQFRQKWRTDAPK